MQITCSTTRPCWKYLSSSLPQHLFQFSALTWIVTLGAHFSSACKISSKKQGWCRIGWIEAMFWRLSFATILTWLGCWSVAFTRPVGDKTKINHILNQEVRCRIWRPSHSPNLCTEMLGAHPLLPDDASCNGSKQSIPGSLILLRLVMRHNGCTGPGQTSVRFRWDSSMQLWLFWPGAPATMAQSIITCVWSPCLGPCSSYPLIAIRVAISHAVICVIKVNPPLHAQCFRAVSLWFADKVVCDAWVFLPLQANHASMRSHEPTDDYDRACPVKLKRNLA